MNGVAATQPTMTHDHRRREDREANPTVVVAGGIDVVEVVEQSGREHERDVTHDEHEEPDEHEEMQRSCRLDAEHLADPLEAGRECRGHAEPGDERKRGGDEDRDEVREQLKTVVGDPSVLGRPVQRQVLDQHRQGVGKHRPGSRHHTTPLRRREQQDVEDETVEQPEGIGTEVPPACEADRVPDAGQSDLAPAG